MDSHVAEFSCARARKDESTAGGLPLRVCCLCIAVRASFYSR